MEKNIRYIALIPAYNPDDKLIKLINDIKKESFDIVVIDDGSNKSSSEIFKKIDSDCHILHHKVNKGKGEGIKTGLRYIKENYKEYIVVTMDCDGQHLIEDAIKLCKYNENHLNTLCLGSRRFDNHVPLRSKIGNTITRRVFAFTTGTKIYDTQTGLRSFSHKLVDTMLEINGERFEYEINVLLEASKRKIPIKEIEIKTIYINNNSSSHFNTITDSFKVYKKIIKFSIISISSFFIDFILYTVFSIFLNYAIANIIARIISASYNFLMNKNIVFKYQKNYVKALLKYTLLALTILSLNLIILSLFINLGINKYIAKIIVELILFIVSYTLQDNYIFPTNIK